MDLDHYHNTRNWRLENNIVEGFNGEAVAVALPVNADTTVDGGAFNNSGIDLKIREVNWARSWPTRVVSYDDNNMDPLTVDKTTPWRNILIQGNIQFSNTANNIVLDPQLHMTNPAQDSFGILDGDFKMSGYHLLPDNIRLNFGPFNNAKVYFDQQRADFVPVTTATRLPLTMPQSDLLPDNITPTKYINKTNQQLLDQYGASFGGEILPDTAVAHHAVIGGKLSDVSGQGTSCGPVSYSVIQASGSSYLALTVTHSQDSADQLQVQRSTDLVNWTDAGVVFVSNTQNADGTETFVYRSSSPFGTLNCEYLRCQLLGAD